MQKKKKKKKSGKSRMPTAKNGFQILNLHPKNICFKN